MYASELLYLLIAGCIPWGLHLSSHTHFGKYLTAWELLKSLNWWNNFANPYSYLFLWLSWNLHSTFPLILQLSFQIPVLKEPTGCVDFVVVVLLFPFFVCSCSFSKRNRQTNIVACELLSYFILLAFVVVLDPLCMPYTM